MSGPKELLASAKRQPGGFFNSIEFGSIVVSIQGSKFHYCSPRIDLENLADYDSLEIAILQNNGEEKRFINIHEDEKFSKFEWAVMFEEGSNPVAGYVPISEIERIMKDIISLTNQMKN
ncbi:MAG TPA: hypothetical protein VMX17_08970 [Candidatus Glassbacteria bacterium]|nr:hypothetical protein [Candidatus Glassbacteria bacterium]